MPETTSETLAITPTTTSNTNTEPKADNDNNESKADNNNNESKADNNNNESKDESSTEPRRKRVVSYLFKNSKLGTSEYNKVIHYHIINNNYH